MTERDWINKVPFPVCTKKKGTLFFDSFMDIYVYTYEYGSKKLKALKLMIYVYQKVKQNYIYPIIFNKKLYKQNMIAEN